MGLLIWLVDCCIVCFHNYSCTHWKLSALESVTGCQCGWRKLCCSVIDVTTYAYFTFFDPLVYGTFLWKFFRLVVVLNAQRRQTYINQSNDLPVCFLFFCCCELLRTRKDLHPPDIILLGGWKLGLSCFCIGNVSLQFPVSWYFQCVKNSDPTSIL